MTGNVGRQKRKKTGLGERERRSLLQLGICLLLFLTVFFGRGIFPSQTEAVRLELLSLIRRDTDFQTLWGQVRSAAAEKKTMLTVLDDVMTSLQEREKTRFLASSKPAVPPETRMQVLSWSKPGLTHERTEETHALSPAQRDLGLGETVTPVEGVLSSKFGLRVHPIDGEWKLHQGIDLAADTGTQILAYADGEVDYIGESEDYGQYLQLRHENGVTTFYAHCSELLVQKGTKVSGGQLIAKVGETGRSTGPHLHFEIKKEGELLDPLPYVEYEVT